MLESVKVRALREMPLKARKENDPADLEEDAKYTRRMYAELEKARKNEDSTGVVAK